ncbi:probable polygalacturonase At1g80170 [Selaginella moellendorffii]|uniref:probable polygalacturonase At1g80170 n=1 Tax=Selaginella moellendorffii TaxID=88036 RepID=UPI000D1C8DC0|nr:probable polygalacturonase At1g80170 [Selaginella moellendorffii]|eukprot:XP_024538210.1 probable polygalacturonase At1g80170 [Selaginella moellendorffii]
MNDVAFPVIINQFYCDSVLPCENQTDAVQVHDVYFKNIRGTSRTDFSVYLACSDTVPCQNIFLQDVSLTLSGSNDLSTTSSFCWNAMGEWYGAEDPYNCLGSSDTQTSLQFCATTNSKNN